MPGYVMSVKPICPGCFMCSACSPTQLLVIGVAALIVLSPK